MYTLHRKVEYYHKVPYIPYGATMGLPDEELDTTDYELAHETHLTESYETLEDGHTRIKQLIAELQPFEHPSFNFYYTVETTGTRDEDYLIQFTLAKEVPSYFLIEGKVIVEEYHDVYLVKDKD